MRYSLKTTVLRRHNKPSLRRYTTTAKYEIKEVQPTSPQFLTITWGDGAKSRFHYVWLRDNCFSTKEPSSQQKLVNAASISLNSTATVTKSTSNSLYLEWLDRHISHFPGKWLRENCYDTEYLTKENLQEVVMWNNEELQKKGGIPVLKYNDIMNDSKAVWHWALFLSSYGITRVTEIPVDPTGATIEHLMRKLGRLKVTMYDLVDHVKSVPNPSNVAYTNIKLLPHMDLCYYEAIPGIQALHCIQNASEGGANFYVDGFKVAEVLKHRDRNAFNILSRVPTSFQKIDPKNHRIYRRPLITADPVTGSIVGINYSPQFEGPLKVKFDDVIPYYTSYKKFVDLANSKEFFFYNKMEAGDAIVFNNRRVFHAREAFSGNTTRHIQTCYVDTDEFSSTWRLLKKQHEIDSLSIPPIGSFTF